MTQEHGCSSDFIKDHATRLLLNEGRLPALPGSSAPRQEDQNHLLMGTYVVKSDEKGRITIPSKHLQSIGEQGEFIGVRSSNSASIYVFSKPLFLELIRLSVESETSVVPAQLEQVRFSLQNAGELKRDKLNRININSLMQSDTTKLLEVKGSGNFLEITPHQP